MHPIIINAIAVGIILYVVVKLIGMKKIKEIYDSIRSLFKKKPKNKINLEVY